MAEQGAPAVESQKPEAEKTWLEKVYEESSKKITGDAQFLGYGILVAMFSFGKPFFQAHTTLALIATGSAFVSLLLIYSYTAYLFLKSASIQEDIKRFKLHLPQASRAEIQRKFEPIYEDFRQKSILLFWLFQFTLFLAVVSFGIAAGIVVLGN